MKKVKTQIRYTFINPNNDDEFLKAIKQVIIERIIESARKNYK